MKVLLSEHSRFDIYLQEADTDPTVDYFAADVFGAVATANRRYYKQNVYPYVLQHNKTENRYELKADYYIGLDWLVIGKKYVQVEPKVNAKLLEIYHQSLITDKELSDEEQAKKDKENKVAIKKEEACDSKKVNYIKMLLDVYASNIPTEKIGLLTQIYWEEKPIKIEQKDDYLTPFLVAQFLSLLKTIVKKGLKKSYYKVQENLNNRVKGKILVGQHIKQNVFKNRLTKTFCEYQVFGENSDENQYLKKVFQFCTSFVHHHRDFFKDSAIDSIINYCRPAFEQIESLVNEHQLRNFKYNPFFKEYKEAITVGRYILKQFGYNISSITGSEIETAPFWIDMPRLFELYVYQKLLKDNPNDTEKIKYQFGTYGNHLDFLIKNGENSMIVDTKYKLKYRESAIHADIRQVSGYARLNRIREELTITDDQNIRCLIIYPLLENGIDDYSLEAIKTNKSEIPAYHKVY